MITLPDSPFAAFIDTNYAASPEEILQIKSIVLEPLQRLAELDNEIARSKADREQLHTFIDKHNALLSPFRRLSIDMMIEIFIHCLPDGFCTRDITQPPLLLTRVCRSWRELAIRTPKLWHAVHINLPVPLSESDQDRYNQLLRTRKDGLELWLDRSGEMPVNISVSMGLSGSQMRMPAWNVSPSFDRSLYRGFGSLVSSHSRRWKTITLTHIPENIMDAFVAHLSRGSLPMLESISVTALRTDLERPQMLLVHLLDAAGTRRLRRLHICRIPDTIFDLKSLHWTGLTHLHVVDPSGSQLPSILIERLARTFPSLNDCTLIFGPHILSTGMATTTYTGPATTWPHLRKLHLSFHGLGSFRASFRREAITLEEIRNVFDAILAPSLRELTIHHIINSSLADIQRLDQQYETPFHEFLVQSGCAGTLTHLDVNLLVPDHVLLRSLELLTSLKSLIVKHERSAMSEFSMGRALAQAGFGTIGGPNTGIPRPGGSAPPGQPLLNQRFFRKLTPPTNRVTSHQDSAPDSDIICPRLEEIRFSDCSPDDVEDILQLAQTRASPPSSSRPRCRLQLFKVAFGPQPADVVDVQLDSVYVRNELKKLKAKGMRVEWNWAKGEVPVVDRPNDGMPAPW